MKQNKKKRKWRKQTMWQSEKFCHKCQDRLLITKLSGRGRLWCDTCRRFYQQKSKIDKLARIGMAQNSP